MSKRLLLFIIIGLIALPACSQEQLKSMSIEEYEPESTLKVSAHPIEMAKYPFVDVHSHHSRAASYSDKQMADVVAQMDSINMAVAVNLSGGIGDRLKATVEAMQGRYPSRFIVFANVDFDGIDKPGWTDRAVAQLREDVANGAQGLKIYKSLGLSTKDSEGNRVAVDDPRIDPVWALCGELGIPVLIHTGEPSPFWSPRDRYNERWLELKQRPGRYRDPDEYPSWEETMAQQHNIFRKHPGTTFINAHLGWYGNDLAGMTALMEEFPNMYTELGAVLAELGRQPRAARQFLIDNKERVMFGKDHWAMDEYRVYFRTFETADEFFDYYRKRHAHWKLYGLDLPDDVIRHLYYRNALKVIPGIDASLFPD